MLELRSNLGGEVGWRRERVGPKGCGQDGRSNPTLSAIHQPTWCRLRLVYGGSRLHLRDDWSRTPSGPEGSSGSDFKSGAEVLQARAAS